MHQPGVGFAFIPERDVKCFRVESKSNLTNIQTLRIDIVVLNIGKEQNPNSGHGSFSLAGPTHIVSGTQETGSLFDKTTMSQNSCYFPPREIQFSPLYA